MNKDQTVGELYFNWADIVYMFHLVPYWRLEIQIQDILTMKTKQKLSCLPF